ncbi:SGNH/GDSL hydrolase family protein [Trinickia fusca]|uniref:SGNH/GDSL hydrolase family protein n=1 Tax=Trinickia fusca TaxID=2419777 RepID=A0A494X0L8_9BURK|nr:SGNH/GDSL hydrolase family protein [Trinickia fusca]RKP44298.1 SGNH/GDSL hydrolase family protein [Trinickia fusca]
MTVRALVTSVAALCGAALIFGGAATGALSAPTGWVTSWATGLQSIPELTDPPMLYRAPDVGGRTVREIVYPTLSGRAVRIRMSNIYGRTPLEVADVRIAQSAGGASVRSGTSMPVTFGGRTSIVVAPGREVDSDPIAIDMHAGVPYAISILAGAQQRVTAWHRVANQINYVSTQGDHTTDIGAGAFSKRFTEHAWVSALTVDAVAPAAAVVAIGDSITDGLRSSLNRNRRWPDVLARRIGEAGDRTTAVLNLGISGNRLLSDSPCYGEALERRFDRDALSQQGVKTIVLMIGINDINFAAMPPRVGLDCDAPHTTVTAGDLIAGYRHLVDAAHRRGVRVIGATMTPAALPPERERIRTAVNEWIRTGRAFDGVVDFDAVLRDPAQPGQLRRDYDSGDRIHPNDDGYAAMAVAVPLAWLTASGRGS